MNPPAKQKFTLDNDSGWVETPKLRHGIMRSPERKATSVPSSPSMIQSNHFEILSPSLSSPSTLSSSAKKHRHRKKKKTPQHGSSSSRNSPLSQELMTHDWDDHIVPINDEDTLPSPALKEQQTQAQQPDVSLRQISFLDYLKDELTVADFDSAQELKRERVTNFLGVPGAIEKVQSTEHDTHQDQVSWCQSSWWDSGSLCVWIPFCIPLPFFRFDSVWHSTISWSTCTRTSKRCSSREKGVYMLACCKRAQGLIPWPDLCGWNRHKSATYSRGFSSSLHALPCAGWTHRASTTRFEARQC